MKPELVRPNLEMLIKQGESVLATAHTRGGPQDGFVPVTAHVDAALSKAWAINARAFLRKAFGPGSDHYTEILRTTEQSFLFSQARDTLAVLRGALIAWDNGYATSLRQDIEIEVELSLIDQAQELLEDNGVWGAAVLAGAALEQHLRSLCAAHGVPLIDARGNRLMLKTLNDALHSANVYDAAMKGLIKSLTAIRNDAAHGNKATTENSKLIVTNVVAICANVR